MVVEDRRQPKRHFRERPPLERATLHDGDNIHIGKHKIKVDSQRRCPAAWTLPQKAAAPRIDETMVRTPRKAANAQQAAAMANPCSLRARA